MTFQRALDITNLIIRRQIPVPDSEIDEYQQTVCNALRKLIDLGIDASSVVSKPQKQTAEVNGTINGTINDPVNNPSHYTHGGIECIEAIRASMSAEGFKGFLKGNVIKYLWRYQQKGKPLEDLKKADKYLEWLEKENGDGEA